MVEVSNIRQQAVTSIVVKYSSLPISKGIKELQEDLLATTNQLSDLINARYQDFISLPDGLTGMDKVIDDVRQDIVNGDKLMGVGANVALELKRRKDAIDAEIVQCKESLRSRRELQKEIKLLSYYLQLDQGRKRVQDLYDNLLSLVDSQPVNLTPESLNSIIVGLDRVSRELVYVTGNLNISSSADYSSAVVVEVSKSVEKLKVSTLELVEDLLLKTMEKISLRDNTDVTSSSHHLAILIRVSQELDSSKLILNAFTECLIDPFLLEMNVLKKNGSDFKKCLQLILNFTKEKCRPIYAVNTTSSSTDTVSVNSAACLLVNGVWENCVSWIVKEFESVFLVGSSLANFHESYNEFARFLVEFETICLELNQAEALKNSPVYKEINKKWQLSVYCQLCHNDITQEFESCFSNLSIGKDSGRQLATPHSAVKRAIERFWGLESAIRAISPRIWKSTLIVIHRYISWNTASIPVSVESAVSSLTTPHLSDIQALALNYSNLLSTMGKIERTLAEKIPLLLAVDAKTNDVWSKVLKPALQDAFEVDGCASKMRRLLVDALACLCYDGLSSSDKIPAQYRRTGKEAPVSPSFFIPDCFAKIKELVLSNCSSLETEERQGLLRDAAIKTLILYSSLVSKTLDSVKKTEEALKKFIKVRKQPSNIIASTSSMSNMAADVRDEDKIRHQFSIDAASFLEQISSLGIDISSVEECKTFQDMILIECATTSND